MLIIIHKRGSFTAVPQEQKYIQSTYAFELSKVEMLAVREPVISFLNIDQTLAKTVAKQRFYQREPYPLTLNPS